MASELWNPIAASRVEEGKLFTPGTALHFLGNDWSCLSHSFDWSMHELTWADLDTTWQDMFTFSSHTNTFALDVTFGDLVVVVSARVQIKRSIAGSNDPQFRLYDGTNSSNEVSTSSTSYVTSDRMTLEQVTIAPVVLQMRFEATNIPATTGFVKRDFGSLGLDSYFRVGRT